MKPILTLAMTGCLAMAFVAAQSRPPADLYQEAVRLEEIKGDLKSAIEQYKRLADGRDRAIAAKALVRMAECYEKLGHSDARKTYERVVREFSDQVESAAAARMRLAALSSSPVSSGQAARLIWDDVDQSEYRVTSPSADGRYLSFTDGATGNLVVRDFKEGTNRRLTDKGSWFAGGGVAGESVVSPDGRQVAYVWDNNSGDFRGYDLRVLPLTGEAREPRIVHRSAETRYIQTSGWSPDGKHLLIVRQLQDRTYQIVSISIADRSARVLKSLEWRQPGKVSLSPDGRLIAYDAPGGIGLAARDIFLLAVDGGRETVVVQNSADDQQPVWSPDGSQLLFVSNRTGNSSLWAVHIDAGKARGAAELVKPNIGRLLGMTRSGSLFYVSGGPTRNIYIADVDAKMKAKEPPSLATDRLLNSNSAPVWSPDGRSLAFFSSRTPFAGPNSLVILVRSLETGEQQEVPFGRLPANRRMQWFPDGRSLLVGSQDLQRNLTAYYRVQIANGNSELLFHAGLQNPALSADGKAIVYIGRRDDGRGMRLLRFDVDSRREMELRSPDLTITAVAISPDGTQLAYNSTDSAANSTSVGIMPMAGGEPRSVFSHAGAGPERNQLAWTPDQRHLLFVIDRDGTPSGTSDVVDLWRVPVAGGVAEKIGISVKGRLRFPALDPSGKRLAFEAVESRPYELWALENFLPMPVTAR